MNKKGFTLVELLTVIILLSLIALITTPVIIGVLGSSKQNLQTEQYKIIEKAAERWGMENLNKLPNSGSCYINMGELQSYLSNSENIKDPKTGKTLDGVVKITKTGNQYKYEYISTLTGYHCGGNN